METSNQVIWRLDDTNRWLLYSNTHITLPALKQDKSKEQNKDKSKKVKKEANTPFYFAKTKAETKGSLVYTPKGYGIVQGIKPEQNLITVKVNNEIQEFNRNDVTNEITINLTYITSSGKREDKVILPIHATAKDVIERIESESEGETALCNRIFYLGREFNKSNETVEKMGITPLAKFLIISAMGKPLSVSRFNLTCNGWGYSSSSIDGISFSPSRDIRVIGFGIYTGVNDTVISGTAKFIQGNDAKATPVYERELELWKNDENREEKIYKFMFDRPVRVKAGESYSCVVDLKNGNSYYGSGGNTSPIGEQDVMFTITDCIGSPNETSTSSGQIPEFYYYV